MSSPKFIPHSIIEMVKRTQRGSGYGTPQEYFDLSYRQPSSTEAAASVAPSPGWVRPPLIATSTMAPAALGQKGGASRRQTRKMRGGFAPELMGAFVANAQTVAVPLALYGLYTMVAKKAGSTVNTTTVNRNRHTKGGKRGTRRH